RQPCVTVMSAYLSAVEASRLLAQHRMLLDKRKGGYRLRRRNGRMIRAQKTVEESRLCGKGRKRK
ncbi:hypothetical protein M9458_009987, partial [Cirrhinus mrigala]